MNSPSKFSQSSFNDPFVDSLFFFSFRTPPSFLAMTIAAAANEAQKAAAAKQRRRHRGARAVLASVLLCAFRLLLERFSNNGPSQFSLQWPFSAVWRTIYYYRVL